VHVLDSTFHRTRLTVSILALLWTQGSWDRGQARELQMLFSSDVQFHNVETELRRQPLMVPVRKTPQLTFLHLQSKQMKSLEKKMRVT
jgi:hypothetical protein